MPTLRRGVDDEGKRVLIIEVQPDLESFFMDCPLKGDRNNCGAISCSPINLCPDSHDDEDGVFYAHVPKECPLREGSVVIRFEQGFTLH